MASEADRTRQLQDRDLSGGPLLLRVLSGNLKGQEVALPNGQPFLIGSSFDATLQLPDSAVSRLHLELVHDNGIVHAKDLGSTNGSFYEGSRFTAIDLKPGAIVRVGETDMQILAEEDAHPLPPSEETSFGRLLGKSRRMREVFAVLERAARSDATLLVTGETGTGKELVADAVHQASARRDKPFVVVDCTSIPANLMESELFGHVKGAYTHADTDRRGAFLDADGGTIFLDEIGELPVDMQPRLLRVLETRTIKPVGSNHFHRVDVRVIAATNRNLEDEVKARRFRSDLYFRLAVIKVRLPALRDRREDIVLIARKMADDIADKTGKRLDFTPETVAALISHDWPGNVRELRNVVQQAASLSAESLSLALRLSGKTDPTKNEVAKMVNAAGALGLEVFYDLPFRLARKRAIKAFELGYVRNAIQTSDGSVSRAAEKAGLHRNMLHRILAREKDDSDDEADTDDAE